MKRLIVFVIILCTLGIATISCAKPIAENNAYLSDERLYIDYYRSFPFYECDFGGSSFTVEDLQGLCLELNGIKWLATPDALAEYGLDLNLDNFFQLETAEEREAAYSDDRIDECILEMVNEGEYMSLRVNGYLGDGWSSGRYWSSLIMYFRLEDEDNVYVPHLAHITYDASWINSVKYVIAGGHTWIVVENLVCRGTGYYEESRSWYNLDYTQHALSYILDYHDEWSEQINAEVWERNIYYSEDIEVGDETLVGPDESAFSIEVFVSIMIKLEYFDDEWFWMEITDNIPKEMTVRFTYDPQQQAFYTMCSEEYYVLSMKTYHPLPDYKFKALFYDELIAMAHDDFRYRSEWAKKMLNVEVAPYTNPND